MERLFQIHCNVVQMLQDRKYEVPEKYIFASLEMFTLPEEMIVSSAKKDGENCFVLYEQGETSIGVRQVKDMVDAMTEHKCVNGILVCKHPVTPFAKRVIQELLSSSDLIIRKQIECFEQSELYINITQHNFVPQHILLTSKEKSDVVKRYKLKKESQLPRLLHNDPIARYYGMHKGQVVKIVRYDKTLEQRFVSYRVVV